MITSMHPSEAARRVLLGDTSDADVLRALQTGSDQAGQNYYLLLSAIGHNAFLKHVPGLLKRIIKEESWRRWVWVGNEFEAKSLTQYLTEHPPKGIGASLEMVSKLIEGDAEAEALFRKHTTAPHGTNQHTGMKDTDNISLLKHGTSRAYTLDRLSRLRPDLFDAVKEGRMSANAAALEAGFRKPKSPVQAARSAWNRATMEERKEIARNVIAFDVNLEEMGAYLCKNLSHNELTRLVVILQNRLVEFAGHSIGLNE